jgi:hypothetical protein
MVDAEERARRERTRIKLFSTILVTYGYALLGGALWEPLTKAQILGAQNLVLAAIALSMHAIALYIAPRGEAQ